MIFCDEVMDAPLSTKPDFRPSGRPGYGLRCFIVLQEETQKGPARKVCVCIQYTVYRTIFF